MTKEKTCELCGDVFHQDIDPPEKAWMGLRCPGDAASQDDKDAFRTALAQTYAEEVKRHAIITLEHDDDFLERRAGDWSGRTRPDGNTKEQLPVMARHSAYLQADVDVRVDTEVTRQKREEVWQEPVFDIDIPHLTVVGETPQGSTLSTAVDTHVQQEDYQLYVDPNPDA